LTASAPARRCNALAKAAVLLPVHRGRIADLLKEAAACFPVFERLPSKEHQSGFRQRGERKIPALQRDATLANSRQSVTRDRRARLTLSGKSARQKLSAVAQALGVDAVADAS
jgi:hypothetical protein